MRHRKPRSGKLPIKLIIIVLVVLGGGAFAATRFMGKGEETDQTAEGTAEGGKEAAQAESQESPAQTATLGEFLVNIRSKDGQLRYLKAEISAVVHETADKDDKGKKKGHGHDASDESEAELPPASQRYARDVTIAVLANQQFETLRTAEGKRQLKATLQQKLDAALGGYRVSDILFTAFVMQ